MWLVRRNESNGSLIEGNTPKRQSTVSNGDEVSRGDRGRWGTVKLVDYSSRECMRKRRGEGKLALR